MLQNAIKNIADYARWVGVTAVFAIISGCATAPGGHAADPFETFNRGVFRFNDTVDEAVLQPAAKAYRDALPSPVRTGVNNFFGNLGDVWSLANSVLQLKLQYSAETFMRLNVNTLLGLGGLLDIATEIGIDRHPEDFGQTLGYWGMPPGPYVVLPLYGPSTLRDTAAFPIDRYADPLLAIRDIPVRNGLTLLRVVDGRSSFLRASQLLDDAALDKYSFTRDAWLQKRRYDIYDGNPPELPDEPDDPPAAPRE